MSKSTTNAPISSQRKLGNLLPGLLLAPVVGTMSLGDEREEKTGSRNSQQTGKKTVATSPQKLKKSMRKFAIDNAKSSRKSLTSTVRPRSPDSTNGGFASPERVPQGSSDVGANLTPAAFSEECEKLPQLKTSEDAIAYFAKSGDTAAIKFIHLNRANTGNDFRPYDLVVVPPNEVHEEHYVFSSKGVMFFTTKRGQDLIKKSDRQDTPTNILTLSRWVYEAAVFKMLRNYSTFKNYLIWKMFNNWNASVKFKLFCKVRNQVGQKLFILKKIFQETILSVQKKTAIFRTNAVLNFALKKTLTLDQFEALQTARLAEVSSEVDHMCQESFAEASDVSGHIKEELKILRKRLAEPSIKKSMADERIEREGLLAAIDGLSKDKVRMIKFLKLIDRMLIETMFLHARDSYEMFVDLCSTPRSSLRMGVVKVGIDLGPNIGEFRFHPSQAAMTSRIDELVDGMLTVMNNAPRLSLPSSAGMPLAAGELLFRDEALVAMRGNVRDIIAKGYALAHEYGSNFDQYRNVYSFVGRFNTAVYSAEEPSFQKLSSDLDQLGTWTKDIGRMRLERNVSPLIMVDARRFKQVLSDQMEVPQKCIMALILGEGRDLALQVIKCYRNHCTEMMVQENMSLNKQAVFVAALNESNAVTEKYENRVNLIHDIYKRLDKMDVKVPLDDRTQLDDVMEWKQKFVDTKESARVYIKEQAASYEDKLREQIVSLERQCNDITSSLNQPPFTNQPSQENTASNEETTEVINALEDVARNAEVLKAQATQLSNVKTLFDGIDYICTPVETLESVYEQKKNLWDLYHKWRTQLKTFFTSDLTVIFNPEANDTGLNAPGLEKLVDEYFSDGSAIARKMPGDKTIELYISEVKSYRVKQTMMGQLGHPSLLPRHWQQLYAILGEEFDIDDAGKVITLKELESYGVFLPAKLDALDEVCAVAGKEYSLQKAMDKMEEEWAIQEFGVKAYKETGTCILSSTEEIEGILDDQIVRSQAMRGSRFIKPFEARIIAWEQKLKLLADIIENWMKVQGTWLYLEPIFSSPDIRKQMPGEAKRFLVVDKIWREMMATTQENSKVLYITEQEGVLDNLKKSNELLNTIQKGLADYLNKKRIFFPRFFFLSNDELLEILSETKDPLKVLPHLKKCFEGIYSLSFNKEMDILSMISAEKESVNLEYEGVNEKVINPDDAHGCVEVWLDQIQTVMRKTIAYLFDGSVVDYAKQLSEDKTLRCTWLQNWPGQVVLGVSQLYWTIEVTRALKEKGLEGIKELASVLQGYIDDIITMVRGKISKAVKKTVSPLVVLDKHALDTVLAMVESGVHSPQDFDWLAQMRYYWTEGGASAQSGDPGSVLVKMINAQREYAFEYLGNSMRLVVTPLTDRCYRTLMGAIHLDYGGAPAGPAGTGKTETVKDLGKACAIQCVVYNCSDSLDYKAMGKFFKGLAGTGAWSCFDEFNRIDLEVLSVIAQQILTITRAKVAKLDRFDFEGENIILRRTCNVFVTMNPGYAGRQELPDNLKALFRAVAMMVPDYAMIGEIILYSMGYLSGGPLANKIVMTYKLCSEQLSSQRHYDYGMRAVVTVLRACGNLKSKFPDDEEAKLCLRSIIDVNLPKFLAPDVPLFNGIVGDLFPGVHLDPVDRDDMLTVMKGELVKTLLQPTDYFITKTFEIYEMMIVRHGFMIVGQPYSGKSNALKTLASSLSTLKVQYPDDNRFNKVYYTIINPKSITMGQLYGQFDPVSHEWTDGVLAISYRNYAAEPPKIGNPEDLKWVWFDGPVDAIWIENMNTVLDDNKKLCLMSGEMMAMSSTMSMIFEPMDLEVASPATVSRVGVVYMEPFRMGWRPCLDSWLTKYTKVENLDVDEKSGKPIYACPEMETSWKMTKDQAELVKKLILWIADPCICFVRKMVNEQIEVLDQTIIVGMLRIIESIFEEILVNGDGAGNTGINRAEISQESADMIDLRRETIECTVLFSAVWSIGATADEPGRSKFDTFIKEFIADSNCINRPDLKGVLTLLQLRSWETPMVKQYKMSNPFPEEGSVYSYLYVPTTSSWILWMDSVEKSFFPPDAEFSSLVVPNQITAQLGSLLELLITHQHTPLVCGPTGTGKSVFINQLLNQRINQEVYKSIVIAFTAKTSANMTQDQVDQKLDKRRKGVYGPAFGCKAVVFVDDLNMPEVEEYGAQPPIELLRQMVDNGGWYDVKEKDFHEFTDVQLLCAMGPPGGGRNSITPRMMRHFSILCVTDFSEEDISQIYMTIVDWNMNRSQFSKTLSGFSEAIVSATLNIYRNAQMVLLPTPKKSHYTFNLRDFSRIIQGFCLVKPYEEFDELALKRLWVHESSRVIMDRLLEENDKVLFMSGLREVVDKNFGNSLDELIGFLDPEGKMEATLTAHRRLFFGNYLDMSAANPEYIEIQDVDGLVTTIDKNLDLYNQESKTKMDLVMFVFAIEHISRISRVLAMPGGSALLVGVGGSGRQSLTRLASFTANYSLKQIELSKNYAVVDWQEDLKDLLKAAGTGKKHMVFLFSDTQVKFPIFIENINSLLNSGSVPNLFGVDDKMQIVEAMRGILKNHPDLNKMTPNDIFNHYLARTKDRLHIVLAFSPIGDTFRERLRKFPALVNNTTIDWFFAWPKDALIAVAQKFFNAIDMEDHIRQEVVLTCQFMHGSVRDLSLDFSKRLKRINYVTPTSYLELIRCFSDNLATRRGMVTAQKDRYVNGLTKLAFAQSQVSEMQEELTAKLPTLAVAKEETAALMETIQKELPGVKKLEKSVGEEAAVVKVQADECAAMKKECEDDLAEAIPLLESAIKALNTLKKSDLDEVKAMGKPPSGVVLTLTAVCHLMGVHPEKIKDPEGGTKKINDFWGPSKKHLLGDSKFIQRLKDYDKDNIDPKIVKKLRDKFVNNPDFQPDVVKKASVAAYGLCCWVRAMEAYDRVAKVVGPKKEKLKETEAELQLTLDALAGKEKALQDVKDNLANLEKQFQDATNKKEQLEADVDLCEKKLVRAKQLIDGLGGEQVRWTQNVAQLTDDYENVTGNVLMSAGLIAYLGAFTAAYRDGIIKSWASLCKEKHIPCAENPSLLRTLGDPVVIRQWNAQGLPTDSFSVDNAIVIFNSRRWPLMIDPQGQANKWIRTMESNNALKVVKLTQGQYMRTVENAVQFGSPVLLENVGEVLDPTLEPLLQKAVFKQGGVMCIRLGDSTVEYSDMFRFYITTKLTNPHYLPEVSVKVTLLNFMITPEGLQDQLLAIVVKEERPELAEEKERLIVEGAENAKALKDVEDEILHILATSTGNILEDEGAIKALNMSKEISTDIKEKQAACEVTEAKIDEVRSGYIPIAYHSQILYFCIADLANIEPTYQYALGWFSKLFITSIRTSEPASDVHERLKILEVHFTYSLYNNVCRSLLEKDKLLFSFLLAIRIKMGRKEVDSAEWYFLLTGGVSVGNPHPNPASTWLSPKSWDEICRLSELPVMQGFKEYFESNTEGFKEIYDAANAHKIPFPGEWNKKLNLIQKLLVLRCLRPDKVVLAVQQFVIAESGEKFVKPPTFNLKACYEDASCVTPLVFVLSAGSDPTGAVLKFGDEENATYNVISLGQGQGPKAEKLMDMAQNDGSWVILQNAHLAISWMPSLERVCESFDADKMHDGFRLWITTYPHPDFPISILQNAIKMTFEPPAGLRANLLGSYSMDPIIDPEFFNVVFSDESLQPVFHKLIYSLCFFHANIQERREFGSLGWNNPYEFNESDLKISVKQLHIFLELYDELPWKALNYSTGQCNYGGRVTDDKDRRCLMAILRSYYNASVLDPNHKISPSGDWLMPDDMTWDGYNQFIENLPLQVEPEVFGLHENANITKDMGYTNNLFLSILLTQSSSGGGDEGGKSQEDVTFDVASMNLQKMPPLFDMELAELKYPIKWDESMNTVLVQELMRYNKLNTVVVQSLGQTKQAMKGTIVMSEELEALGNSLFYGRIPKKWEDNSYPSLKPLAGYVSDLLRRLAFFQDWLDEKPPPVFWFPGLYFSAAFLTGTLQNFARRYTVPIDHVEFDFEMLTGSMEEYKDAPGDGCYIYGLFVAGARWDPHLKAVASSEPKVLFAEAPVMYLNPKEDTNLSTFKHYTCPVYNTSERRGMLSTTGHSTNFVMYIKMPSAHEENHWIEAGVALICQLDD